MAVSKNYKPVNFFSTTINGAINDAVTSVVWNTAPSFTGNTGYIIIDPADSSLREIVEQTSLAGSTGTIVRGRDGTTAKAHSNGATAICVPNAAYLNDLLDSFAVDHATSGRHTQLTGTGGNTLTLPTSTDTLVGRATTDTLTGKTISDAGAGNKVAEEFKGMFYDFVYSGGAVAQSSGLIGTFSNIVYYISGGRYAATSIANKTYTASKDTYVDIGTDGVVDYTEVANNAASPALAASHLRVAIVVTNGSAITVVNQGGIGNAGPTVSNQILDVTDSLGNLVYCRTPRPTLIGYAQRTSDTSMAAETNIPGVRTTVIVPANRKIKISTFFRKYTHDNNNTTSVISIKEESVAVLQVHDQFVATTNNHSPGVITAYESPSTGSHTYIVSVSTSPGNVFLFGDAQWPIYIAVELI